MNTSLPNVLLIGAGHWGQQHLSELTKLAEEGRVNLAGVVVQSDASGDQLRAMTTAPVHVGLDDSLLAGIDAVVIATPSDTHEAIAAKCLRHCDVLIEKPLALTADGAEDLAQLAKAEGRVLMPGHVFRFHPVIQFVAETVQQRSDVPTWLQIDFINAPTEAAQGLDPRMEFIHVFDLAGMIMGEEPSVVVPGQRGEMLAHSSLGYTNGARAHLRVGWGPAGPRRRIFVRYDDLKIEADFLEGVVTTTSAAHEVEKTFFPGPAAALRNQLIAFLERVESRSSADQGANAQDGVEAVRAAQRSMNKMRKDRPRAAVIGGGVFGATIAEELSEFAEVDLFERHDDLLSEVSFVNQWRHHSGFHYPRSHDTIQEIRACKAEFETRFEGVIQRDIPSFFATSRWGVEIPAERYLAACSSNYLAFSIEKPSARMLDPDQVSICMRTDEAVYDIPAMRNMLRNRIAKADHLTLHLGTEVADGRILPDGRKELTAKGPDGTRTAAYDYVVNATYSRINLYAQWFQFPIELLRFDLYEMLVLDIPAEQLCVTVMDAPFCSLVGMGTPNRFLLSHIHDSVLKSRVPPDGMPPDWGEIQSNREKMIKSSRRYMPILEKARVVESRYATRAVNAFARDFDARPTVVRDHGFGCWSVLGGKILTCLSNAREIAGAIRSDIGLDPSTPVPPTSETQTTRRSTAARPVPVQ